MLNIGPAVLLPPMFMHTSLMILMFCSKLFWSRVKPKAAMA
jgi:hypothetical protein